ncbi:MAG: class I SAM-dependent methyltransferase [Elusimicrobia bacterium]|nr:class I SAM-dependent methyltransferase [Elusimicrobiota bacterium]
MQDEPFSTEYEGFFAEFYDIIQADVSDVPFFVWAAAEYGSPVLDLGSGTGRLLLPMAQAGAEVVGLDSSPDMLELCRRKLATLDDGTRGRVVLVQGDMRSFRADRPFALAVLGCNTVLHLLTLEDQVAALRGIHAHLRPAGILIVDNSVPPVAAWVKSMDQEAVFKFANPVNGNAVIDKVTASFDFANQVEHDFIVLEEYAGDKLVRAARTRCSMAIMFPRELRLLLTHCGFEVLHVWKNHRREPFDGEAREVIVMARKA